MGSRLVLAFGAMLSLQASAFRLFPRTARPVTMRSARVSDTSFVLLQGKLYRQVEGGRLVNVSRWPHLSKIAAAGPDLIGLTYHGDLQRWRRNSLGDWQSIPLVDETQEAAARSVACEDGMKEANR